MPELSFQLNGESRGISYEEGMNLLDVLRDECGVTSPKDGCAPQGACGCCTVMVEGRAVLSCLRKPESVEGKSVTTLEGLAEGKRRILAEAFVREGGLQCGYCTPGMVLSASALLKKNPDPGLDEIKEALVGNLCRCTGYQQIIDSVEAAAATMRNGET
ncbi:MAG: (2Fe-2S)-binding protein, partial [Gemmatimonadetes bacterium]|nr:(2Fe-2S)-binding protein [Gemmatimonadota bacterium]